MCILKSEQLRRLLSYTPMLSIATDMQPTVSHSPDVLEVQASMCQMSQPHPTQPIARWIMEEGQLLGVLIASFSSPSSQTISAHS